MDDDHKGERLFDIMYYKHVPAGNRWRVSVGTQSDYLGRRVTVKYKAAHWFPDK